MKEYTGFGADAKILILLLKHGKTKRSDFKHVYGMNYNTAKASLEYMETWKLTEYEALGDRRDTVYYSLTEKGKKVAQMLSEIDEYIRSD